MTGTLCVTIWQYFLTLSVKHHDVLSDSVIKLRFIYTKRKQTGQSDGCTQNVPGTREVSEHRKGDFPALA